VTDFKEIYYYSFPALIPYSFLYTNVCYVHKLVETNENFNILFWHSSIVTKKKHSRCSGRISKR